MRATGNKSGPDKHRLMHTQESTLYTQHASCMHTSAEAPFNGLDLDDRALTRGECWRRELHSARRQLASGSEILEGLEVHLHLVFLIIARPLIVIGQLSTCLQGTGSTASVPHTVTH